MDTNKSKLAVPVVVLQSDTKKYYVSQDEGYVEVSDSKEAALVIDDLNILDSVMSSLSRCRGQHAYIHVPA